MARLTTDMSRAAERPYFLWDETRTVQEFRQAIASAPSDERRRLVGKLMREARDTDVWRFVTPRQVWADWEGLRPHLGRRRAFWEYLVEAWHRDGVFD